MLNINKCRRILGGDAPEGDAELGKIRDALYAVASVIIACVPERLCRSGIFRHCRMFAGLGSIHILVKRPASAFGKYGLLFLAVSIARQHEKERGMVNRETNN